MTQLLIHSMAEFAPSIIQPCLDRAGVADITEIGAEFGGMSTILADHCARAGGTLTSVDPTPKREFLDWVDQHEAVHHVAEPSLEALEHLGPADAWFVDGDHNYYTVYHEMKAIDAICRREDKPLLAFLHDISWPCARRDCYYAPDRIPEEHRHPFSYDAGVHVDDNAIRMNRGWRGMGQFAWALKEGGPKNGVLTAVEDFLAEADSDERPLVFAHVPAVFGLGVVFDAGAEWAEELAGILLPWHQNELIAKLEVNRLRNYLAVIDWQDRQA
ncbi:class I SAM-dependent methyltransferase [Alteraurantiacibacter aquimixticola]|uniref:Class I SAM-dependent methyltransferase n=1 Tax=Alteraurantiacibacter aquimixticola TaxID=2489173 RepID=A0A4T3F568_9SPHN|nr:class I SAM-dependent methyltransferase [Alteraurantiacibacter aquimixticola]TIX51524.1 class I SAM-dependent methyltransferase [Alteraurantiacibacter aquimixticola]